MRKLAHLLFIPVTWVMFTVSATADPIIYKHEIELLGGPGGDARHQRTTVKIILVRPTFSTTSQCETEGTAETVLIYRNGKPSVGNLSKQLCHSSDIPMSSGKVDCESGSIGACLNKD